ncbi:hypothetical protein JCM10213_002431 [Rhodosporidiobolus nylandii]
MVVGLLMTALGFLPAIRRGLLGLLMCAGVCDFVASIVLLAYQLALTSGYQHIVPSICLTSFLAAAFPVWFLFSRPYAIKLPLSSAPDPRVGGARDRVARFSRSILAELVCLGGTGAWTLISVSTLHAETPGLIYHCGGYAICRMLLCVLAVTWICFLFLALSFASLLIATLYFTIRRGSALALLQVSFAAVEWEKYEGRPVGRSGTVGAKAAIALGMKRTKREGEPQHTREDSVAPVLPLSRSQRGVLGQSVISTSTAGGPGLDWDVQSAFTAPWGRESISSSTGRPLSVATHRSDIVIGGGGSGPGLAELARMEEEKDRMEGRTPPAVAEDGSVFVLIDEQLEEKASEAPRGSKAEGQ